MRLPTERESHKGPGKAERQLLQTYARPANSLVYAATLLFHCGALTNHHSKRTLYPSHCFTFTA
eukprot:3937744-Rhodomonas_salina.1